MFCSQLNLCVCSSSASDIHVFIFQLSLGRGKAEEENNKMAAKPLKAAVLAAGLNGLFTDALQKTFLPETDDL